MAINLVIKLGIEKLRQLKNQLKFYLIKSY